MRTHAILVLFGLPGLAVAQVTDFKIYPSGSTADCTSFASRCALGAGAGEVLQEYPMQSRDVLGGVTDFFRGIGQVDADRCELTHIRFATQDQDCSTQEVYSLRVRPLRGSAGGSGPDAAVDLTGGTIVLLTPPGGEPHVCSWSVDVSLATPLAVPCSTSWFVGLALSAAPSWSGDGQSLHGAWYATGSVGDVPAAGAAQISWQIDSSSRVAQCSSARIWDIGVSTECPTLVLGNIHGTQRCKLSPAFGAGGLWPDNSERGDGLAMLIRDSQAQIAIVFIAAAPASTPIPLPGIFDCAPLLIGPSPLIQVAFFLPMFGGRAVFSPAYLGRGRLVGLAAGDPAGADLWFQAATNKPRAGGQRAFSNAVGVDLRP